MNIIGTTFGHFESAAYPPAGTCVKVGHSFGTLIGEGSPNRAIAESMMIHDDAPIVADRTLAEAFPDGSDQIDYIVEGDVSNGIGQGTGTWGTLLAAKTFMAYENIGHALMFGQAYHIGRILLQACKAGIPASAPPNLITGFDGKSDQRWTRSLAMWVPREIIGSFASRLRANCNKLFV